MIDGVSKNILLERLEGIKQFNLYDDMVYDDESLGGTCEYVFGDIASSAHADDFTYGRTKLVLVYNDLDWVVKIPIFVYVDESNDDQVIEYKGAMEYWSGCCSDYCKSEELVYGLAKEARVDMFFAETVHLCDIGGYPIYVSKKVNTGYLSEENCKLDGDIEDIIDYSKLAGVNIKGKFTDKYVCKEFFLSNKQFYAVEKLYDLLDFMVAQHITDLHDSNVGVNSDGKIVILDYPGFFD